jgi:hypothetical protein
MPWPIIPRFQSSDWSGDILGDAEAKGGALLVVWLGLCVEICVGRVRRG